MKVFSKILQSFASQGNFISFHSYWVMEGLIFVILSRCFPIFSLLGAAVCAYLKHISSLYFGFIVAFLFLIHLGESMYDQPRFRPIVWDLDTFAQADQKNLQ